MREGADIDCNSQSQTTKNTFYKDCKEQLKYLDSLCNSLKDKVSPTQLIRASEDRGLWQRMVANVVDDGTASLHVAYLRLKSYSAQMVHSFGCYC